VTELPPGYESSRSERRPRPRARLIGPADSNQRSNVTVRVRRRPGAPPLPDHDYWVATPPGKRRFLTAEEFAATCGAAAEEIEPVSGFAHQHSAWGSEPRVVPSTCPARRRQEPGVCRRAGSLSIGQRGLSRPGRFHLRAERSCRNRSGRVRPGQPAGELSQRPRRPDGDGHAGQGTAGGGAAVQFSAHTSGNGQPTRRHHRDGRQREIDGYPRHS
jgi:hypothetical protein